MAVQNALVFIDGTVQIGLNLFQMSQLLLLLLTQPFHIDICILQLLCPAFHHLSVILEFLFGITDGIQILQQNIFIILYRISQCVAADPAHSLLNLLQLYPHNIKNIFYFIHCLIIALLLKMHLKDHFMNSKLHIVFNLQCGEQQIVPVICEIVGCPPQLLVHINDPVGHITDMHDMIGILVKIKAVEIHGLPLIGENNIHDKIPQLPAFIIAYIFLKVLRVHRIDTGTDIIHGTIFLPQRHLHYKKQHSKNQIDLLICFHKSILLPGCFLYTIFNQQRIHPHMLHPSREMFQKFILHLYILITMPGVGCHPL